MKTLLKNIFSKNTPRWVVLAIDLYIVTNTFVFAYLVRFNFRFDFDTSKLIFQLALVTVAALISFLLIGSYKGVIRHTGLRDSLEIFIASLLILLLLSITVSTNNNLNIFKDFTIPISILVVHFLLNVVVLIMSRFLYKGFYNLIMTDLKRDKRVLIYGAGEAGILTYGVLQNDKENRFKVVGYIDDDKGKSKKKINGVIVFNSNLVNKEFLALKKIDEIIISIQKIKQSKLLEIVNRLSTYDVVVKIVPAAKTWVNGEFNLQQIKQVKIEDLLGRNPISVKNPVLNTEFNGKTVLITGAAGSIGSEMSRQISKFNYKQLILIDQAESELYNLQQDFLGKGVENIVAIVADVRNKKRMNSIFKKYKPAMVFHAAAYKHVPFMENNPYEAVFVNVAGTKIIADLAKKYKTDKFVMISTDKAVNPTNIMGATKRIAEMYINSFDKTAVTKFITTRFGNVLGSNGSVIPLFKNQIEKGGPLTVTDKEMTRFFMTIPEACQLVLEAGIMGNGGEIYVFDMGESIKIFDLALNMIRLSGLKYPEDIDIKISGLRPGEKIYEEVLSDGENTKPTYHKKILIAESKNLDRKKTKKEIETLCILNEEMDSTLTVSKMKEIVPEFISNNSRFELLDH